MNVALLPIGNETNKVIKYKSNDKKVLVDSKGKIVGQKEGKAI